MRRFGYALIFALAPLVVQAETDPVIARVLDDLVLPKVAQFADLAADLSRVAEADCRADNPALVAAWNDAMDGWLAVQDFRFGPLEKAGTRQAIAYWPDSSNQRARVLTQILRGSNPVLQTPEAYSGQSVAARGLYALEVMLYDPKFADYGVADTGCTLVKAASADLAQTAAAVAQDWQGFAVLMRTPGDQNPQYLDVSEPRQAVFTALMTSVQFDVLERLALPMGSPDRPRPNRAEGMISNRSARNLQLSLAGHEALALALVPESAANTATREDLTRVRFMAEKIDSPNFAFVADPMGRFRLETIQTALGLLRAVMQAEYSAALGVTMGLNALDGD